VKEWEAGGGPPCFLRGLPTRGAKVRIEVTDDGLLGIDPRRVKRKGGPAECPSSIEDAARMSDRETGEPSVFPARVSAQPTR